MDAATKASKKSIAKRARALNAVDSALLELEDAIEQADEAGVDVEQLRARWRDVGDEHAELTESLSAEEDAS